MLTPVPSHLLLMCFVRMCTERYTFALRCLRHKPACVSTLHQSNATYLFRNTSVQQNAPPAYFILCPQLLLRLLLKRNQTLPPFSTPQNIMSTVSPVPSSMCHTQCVSCVCPTASQQLLIINHYLWDTICPVHKYICSIYICYFALGYTTALVSPVKHFSWRLGISPLHTCTLCSRFS